MTIPIKEIVLIVGLMLVIYTWLQTFQRKGRATGTITKIAYTFGRVSGGRRSRQPEIAFKVDGQEYTFFPSIVTFLDRQEKKVGSQVPVAYNPANPKDAEIAVPWRLYASPVILTALYGVFLWFSFS
jgi:hypothetical protein